MGIVPGVDLRMATGHELVVGEDNVPFLAPEDGADFSTLLRSATNGLTEAKASGRDRSEMFDEEMRAEATRLLDLEGDRIRFVLVDEGRAHHFEGRVGGSFMQGSVRTGIGRQTRSAMAS